MEQITITAKVQIVATDTDKVLLSKTMSVYCDACNYVSDYADADGTVRNGGADLQHMGFQNTFLALDQIVGVILQHGSTLGVCRDVANAAI